MDNAEIIKKSMRNAPKNQQIYLEPQVNNSQEHRDLESRDKERKSDGPEIT